MCRCADVAVGKMRTKMHIKIRILPAHASPVTGILKSLTFHRVVNRLRSFNGEFMHV